MKIDYEKHLETSLRETGGLDGKQIQACLVQYKIEAAKTNEVAAFLSIIDRYGNCDGQVLLGSVIEQALKKANEQTVDKNPVSRIREHHKRVNSYLENLHALGIEGIELSEDVKLKLPSFVQPENEAKANYKSLERLEFEVR
jgi:hypothetical protein